MEAVINISSGELEKFADYLYVPKNESQLRTWFMTKVRNRVTSFTDFNEFKGWYEKESKICHYCGLTEEESQIIVRKGKLLSKRFPKEGIHGRGTSRGMWLEVDRYDPEGIYSPSNVVLCCYFCNNDKSDVFHGDAYKDFRQNRYNYLKSLLAK
jgi:hypothetical protein